MNVLVIEDNPRLVEALLDGLREEGVTASASDRGLDGLARIRRRGVDVVVLDLGLPDIDGLDLLRTLRGEGFAVPVIVLTARDAIEARVAALEVGADDYLVKPFAFAELVARLRALARRAAGPRWAPLVTDEVALGDDLMVHVGRRAIALSPREHALFAYLARRRGEVVSKPEILRVVFGYDFDPGTNVIEVHVAHLRKKLSGTGLAISTVRGAGIRLEASPP